MKNQFTTLDALKSLRNPDFRPSSSWPICHNMGALVGNLKWNNFFQSDDWDKVIDTWLGRPSRDDEEVFYAFPISCSIPGGYWSGEQGKYRLSLLEHLIDCFENDPKLEKYL